MIQNQIETIFLKLGGSLITDKTVERSFRKNQMKRLAEEIAGAISHRPEMRLLVGHGSGSFGHFSAKRQNTIAGVTSSADWRGFAEVASVASELNMLVNQELRNAGIPAWRIQPSASARCDDGVLVEMATRSIDEALNHGLVPLVYGDVALDTQRGGTIISTETIFEYLVGQIPVDKIILLGEVTGVLDKDGNVIAEITLNTFEQARTALGESRGTDVTGGMVAKVEDMLRIAQSTSDLEIRICDGRVPGLLQDILLNGARPGTVIQT